MTVQITARPTALYRLFDREGVLLYIGVAFDPPSRFTQHRADKSWWPEVDGTKTIIEWHASRIQAESAELLAIRKERPRFNNATLDDAGRRVISDTSRMLAGGALDADRHANPGLTVRPDADVKAAALEALAANNRSIQDFVMACLIVVAKRPAELLAVLDPDWPPPRRRGRPKAEQAPNPS